MAAFSRKSLFAVLGFGSIFAAIAINGALSASQQKQLPPKVAPQYPIVSVTQVKSVTEQAQVIAYGEVKSRNQLQLTSQVSGQIIYLSPKFLSGKTFKQGELIAKIEPISYQQALANAQATLADAELALAQEQLNSEQAKQEWQQSGLANEQASDLVLRKPQLAAAKASFNMAKLAVDKAQYDLKQTRIIAPFDALIVSKDVQQGSNVQSGSALATLQDIHLFEVSLPLTNQQWQLLPELSVIHENPKNWQVTLTDETSQQRWKANIERFEQHIDTQSRQRSLIATIENPVQQVNPLFAGSFVTATIHGQQVEQLWQLPASALIDNETVWQVNDEGLLSFLPVKVVFSQGDYVYVKTEIGKDNINQAKINIVNRPLSSYLENMKVDAKVEEL